MGPLVSHLLALGEIEAVSVPQLEIFGAAVQFARAEGIVPAPEPAHALAVTIREALRCKEEGRSRAILFNLSGHGHFDMQAYLDYFAGKLRDYEYPEEEIAMALAGLPSIGS
jgi:tryptophan synthase beta chain